MADLEGLGLFYLGRRYDLDGGRSLDEPILYDAKDLTTHGVCVGMTGSGKTGLAVTLLEEAVLDGVPVLAIDPKGDLGNLLLAFPDLAPRDFRPWIDEAEAARKGRTADEHAAAVAASWKEGLEASGQDGARVARFRDAARATIYTPGSRAGRPLSILRSLEPPSTAASAGDEPAAERAASVVSALLALVGVEADPLQSREHILLSTIVHRAWSEGRGLDLEALIAAIREPGLDRVGVLDLESFFPAKERFGLAMRLNNLIAAPAFGAWLEGDPLDVARLLYGTDGKPRLSIVSIAHLSDAERMFVVTLLLNETIAWMRAQSGTGSLRAILYMDEVFGFFPPVAEPPSKTPMLTLLKQARAYGLGVLLATQNPVDLDYKGLSNCGTWFLGRLQTERDKARVLDGLEGASSTSGAAFDRAALERTLSSLPGRTFLMRNVHEDEPVVFSTRWALSYLAGPMTRAQIQRVMAERPAAASERSDSAAVAEPGKGAASSDTLASMSDTLASSTTAASSTSAAGGAPQGASARRPVLPPGVTEAFVAPARADVALVYAPALLGTVTLHYSDARAQVEEWRETTLLAPLDEASSLDPWPAASVLSAEPLLEREPRAGATFAALPGAAAREASYAQWTRALAAHAHRRATLRLWRTAAPELVSRPGESEAAFVARARDAIRSDRDAEIERVRSKFAPKLARMREKIRAAEDRVAREQSQYEGQRTQTAISIGATVLGAVFGRKLGGTSSVGRATTAARSAERVSREREDVRRASESLEELHGKLAELEADLEQEIGGLQRTTAEIRHEPFELAPRKSDVAVRLVCLVWTASPALEGAGE